MFGIRKKTPLNCPTRWAPYKSSYVRPLEMAELKLGFTGVISP